MQKYIPSLCVPKEFNPLIDQDYGLIPHNIEQKNYSVITTFHQIIEL